MIPSGRHPIRLRISSSPSQLGVVRAAVEKTALLVGLEAKEADQVVLSVDEALTNIIRHAYAGAEDQPIEIDLAVVEDAGGSIFRIRVRDYGRHVDPARIRPRDLSKLRPGGLGVHIIQKCMDSVEYRLGEGGGTVLTMHKKLGPSSRRTGAGR